MVSRDVRRVDRLGRQRDQVVTESIRRVQMAVFSSGQKLKSKTSWLLLVY